jgi:hypothetical protein
MECHARYPGIMLHEQRVRTGDAVKAAIGTVLLLVVACASATSHPQLPPTTSASPPSSSVSVPISPGSVTSPTTIVSARKGGTCLPTQLKLGAVHGGPEDSTLYSRDNFVTVPIRDVGQECVFRLPSTIDVASPAGAFLPVPALIDPKRASLRFAAGAQHMLTMGDSWTPVGNPTNCHKTTPDVTRVTLPLAGAQLAIALNTTWDAVCIQRWSVHLYFAELDPPPTNIH